MDIAWTPTREYIENAELTRFIVASGSASFDDMQRRATQDPAWFTAQVLGFLNLKWTRRPDEILNLHRGIAWPQWCAGGRLNIVHTCLQHHPERLAIVHESESGECRSWTYGRLRSETARWAAYFHSLGITPGQAIGLHLPMMPETAAVLLAVNQIGAVAVPLFSGFGAAAIATRLQNLAAVALVTVSHFPRRGQRVEAASIARQAAAECPQLRHLIVLDEVEPWIPDAPPIHDSAAEDTAIVIYTSGTTGQPKGIVHTHCGFPVKSAHDMALNIDVHPGERICWITDLGWMMGPWLLYGGLILGATITLYDGAPDFPAPDRLWQFCARHQVNVLGLSPTLIRALIEHGDHLPRRHDLSHLRVLASTGEPWNPDPWHWFFEHVGQKRLPIINYSGGTECSGGILCNTVIHPIKPCGFAAACPGIAADVFDDQGQPVRGAVGELVIKAPWIGQARGFWRDPARYEETYWSRFPQTWVHGDWAQIDPDGHWFIHGRSDDTLKIAGKRIGPAEVESVLVSHPLVTEAAVIGVPDPIKGSAMVAFCVVTGSSAALAAELRALVALSMGKPLAPGPIHFVTAIPKTRNGKIMRRVARAAYLGEDPGDLTALDNAAALSIIRDAALASREPEDTQLTGGMSDTLKRV